MSQQNQQPKSKLINWALFFVSAIAVILLVMLATTIVERRGESAAKLQMVKDIKDGETRNEIWGANFPKEYETYRKTLDTSFKSEHGGSAMIKYLDENPRLVVLWAGYAFSKEYNQGRGHAYAIKDIRNILRTGGLAEHTQPATCWTCKSPDVPRMMNKLGVAEFYKKKWYDLGDEIVNPIGCGDCHDNKTMDLKITRPALVEAYARKGKKIEDFSHNEMRSLVCAQCHVEYYFKKGDNYLTFPWDKGFSADEMEAYYDSLNFTDWTHKLSRAPMLKAQHPDYELFMTGIHADRGVTCVDCHAPYKVEGGIKFTDHHIQSPLNNIANSCQVCHRQSEEELRHDVYERQERVMEIREICEEALCKAHIEAKIAWDNGATEQEMAPVLKLLRHAQWRWDWVAAANGVGFHAPVEALRVLGTSIQRAEQARALLSVIFVNHGVKFPVQMPDISSREKAQTYIGLDMKKLIDDKNALLSQIIPQWDTKAKQRQGTLLEY